MLVKRPRVAANATTRFSCSLPPYESDKAVSPGGRAGVHGHADVDSIFRPGVWAAGLPPEHLGGPSQDGVFELSVEVMIAAARATKRRVG
eukprot:6770278-Alexandrium_andersonii.AAC.1